MTKWSSSFSVGVYLVFPMQFAQGPATGPPELKWVAMPEVI
jgi:hypothetical protein